MIKSLSFTSALATVILLASCATGPFATTFGPRSIELDGENFSEETLGEFISWRCKDYVHYTGTLVEVGYFSSQSLSGFGFVLYDGSNSGEATSYERKGINHRWDWGPNGSDYAFVIKPDGTGLFYDFSSAEDGESIKADEVYECRR